MLSLAEGCCKSHMWASRHCVPARILCQLLSSFICPQTYLPVPVLHIPQAATRWDSCTGVEGHWPSLTAQLALQLHSANISTMIGMDVGIAFLHVGVTSEHGSTALGNTTGIRIIGIGVQGGFGVISSDTRATITFMCLCLNYSFCWQTRAPIVLFQINLWLEHLGIKCSNLVFLAVESKTSSST